MKVMIDGYSYEIEVREDLDCRFHYNVGAVVQQSTNKKMKGAVASNYTSPSKIVEDKDDVSIDEMDSIRGSD